MLQRTCNLLLYDFCVCIYLFLIVWFFYWSLNITYHISEHQGNAAALSGGSDETDCYKNNTTLF